MVKIKLLQVIFYIDFKNNPCNDSETRASHCVDRSKKKWRGCENGSNQFVQQCGSKFTHHLDKREGGVIHMFEQCIRSMQ